MDIFHAHSDFFKCMTRYQVAYGGAGAGKSVVCAQKVIALCMSVPKLSIVVMRKVQVTARLSIFAMITKQIQSEGIEQACKITTSPMRVMFSNGSAINFLGLDNNDKIKSINPVHGFWLEEADQFTETDIDQIGARLRDAVPKTTNGKGTLRTDSNGNYLWFGAPIKNFMMFSFNPISIHNHLYNRFFINVTAQTRAELFIRKTTYLDNPKLSPEYVAQLSGYKGVNETYYNVYCLGEFGTPSGLVYKTPTIIEAKDWPKDYDFRYFGLDFGFNNPSALVEVIVKDRIYYVREIFHLQHLTNDEILERILAVPGFMNETVYCDSANPGGIYYLYQNGVDAMSSNKSVRAGITHVQMTMPRLRVHESSIKLLREFHTYSWRKKGEDVLDEPVKINDHALDAMRYAIYTNHVRRMEE